MALISKSSYSFLHLFFFLSCAKAARVFLIDKMCAIEDTTSLVYYKTYSSYEPCTDVGPQATSIDQCKYDWRKICCEQLSVMMLKPKIATEWSSWASKYNANGVTLHARTCHSTAINTSLCTTREGKNDTMETEITFEESENTVTIHQAGFYFMVIFIVLLVLSLIAMIIWNRQIKNKYEKQINTWKQKPDNFQFNYLDTSSDKESFGSSSNNSVHLETATV
ncbi:uncharacterized protein LOC130657503 [Hydractinia symbiolongicarpus]|uniref:uncharacterized protein LOC130657503 n=1 Tax=Hydractinia symbiolongicarpus TaxID=13093 RepID=UPI00254E8457|nr:uncharacterized protein LOC130657503 [Hydractinia symbiolongicarpus]